MKKSTKTIIMAAAFAAAAGAAVAGSVSAKKYIEFSKTAASTIQCHYGSPYYSVVSVTNEIQKYTK